MANGTNEFDVLKNQMAVLKSNLASKDFISEEMFRKAISAQIQSTTSKRGYYLIGIAVPIALALFFLIKQPFQSTLLVICTVVWCALLTAINFVNYWSNDYENLMSGTITETTRSIVSWRRRMSVQTLINSIAMVIWGAVLLSEIWGDISTNITHAAFVAAIVTIVLSTVIISYAKARKASTKILGLIEDFTKEG